MCAIRRSLFTLFPGVIGSFCSVIGLSLDIFSIILYLKRLKKVMFVEC